MKFKSPNEERIYSQEEKIKTLERLLSVRDTEIRLYRDILESLGVLFTDTLQEGMRCDDPMAPIDIRMTNIYYNKYIAVPIEPERNLKLIDLALNAKTK